MELLRLAIIPMFMLLCLICGGSSQGIWTNAALQVIAIAIIAWAVLARNKQPQTNATKALAIIVGFAVLLIGLQLIPMPPPSRG